MSWHSISQGSSVKCNLLLGHTAPLHRHDDGHRTYEWRDGDVDTGAEEKVWDGTASAATPIIDWLLGHEITASYDDPEGSEPLIRITAPLAGHSEYLYAGGSVTYSRNALGIPRIEVGKPPFLGSARVLGLTLGDVYFIANSKGIRFPGNWGYRADDPVMTLGGPLARCAWNWTLGGARDQRLLVAEIRRRGYEVLESDRGIE